MRFSIIIPLYNKEKYILDTINSVLNQTYTDFPIYWLHLMGAVRLKNYSQFKLPVQIVCPFIRELLILQKRFKRRLWM